MPNDPSTAEPTATNPSAADPTPTDWQSKYEQAVAQSRKWEERSKANAEKAKAYDGLAQQQADAQAAADAACARAEKVEGELAAATRQLTVSRIAAEKGVDASVLAVMSGEDEDAIAANADMLAKSYADRNLYPSVGDNGSMATPPVTSDQIESIKDPCARVMARAEHPELYM